MRNPVIQRLLTPIIAAAEEELTTQYKEIATLKNQLKRMSASRERYRAQVANLRRACLRYQQALAKLRDKGHR
jgi:molecular chaperone GrpE (heat shock protein)